MLNDERIIKNPLFEDLTQQEIEGILSCADARTVRVDRGGTVGLRDPKEPLFGILLSGSLSTTRYDAFGNRFLLLKAEAGEVFGLSMHSSAQRPRTSSSPLPSRANCCSCGRIKSFTAVQATVPRTADSTSISCACLQKRIWRSSANNTIWRNVPCGENFPPSSASNRG